MNILAFMQSALYVISEALLYPVMLILLVLFALVVFRSGEIFSEYLRRRHIRVPEPASSRGLLVDSGDLSTLSGPVRRFVGVLRRLPENRGAREMEIAFRLREAEDQLSWELSRHRRTIRLAPMMGLMGTLIPMGSALAALTEGNLAVMANNLIIAFTTTTVGLFLGGVAYMLALYRGRWNAEDRRAMELLAEIALAPSEKS